MSLHARLETLETRHHHLESKLHDEMNRPGADAVRIADLKREKLKLKDEMESLRQPE